MFFYSKKVYFFFVIFLLFCKPSITQDKNNPEPAIIHEDKDITLLGNILAGLIKPKTNLENSKWNSILQSPVYEQHYKEMQVSWKKTEEVRLQKMREWVSQELNIACKKDHPVFYPFSGPDVLHVQILFPCGNDYILFGLEPPGQLRELSTLVTMNEKQLKEYFHYIQQSLYSNLHYSFFRTNDMKIDFFVKLDGISAVLLTFLVYNQNKIVRVTDISLIDEHTILENKSMKGIPGIRVYYLDNQTLNLKKISYFQIDVSNTNLEKQPFFLSHFKKTSPYLTFLKAASYLMHRDTFSTIRNFILDHSILILQDDSGIPFKYFQKEKWHLILYGNYVQPIPLFRSRYQDDLRKMYLDKNSVRPLPFGTGYHFYSGTSNLLLAIDRRILNENITNN